MKALSIQQPWAWLILNMGKDIENRTWSTVVRGEILIHVGNNMDESGFVFCQRRNIFLPKRKELKTGGIVGAIEIIDCVEKSDSPWFFGPFGFVLQNPITLEFKKVSGQLKFFEVEY